jgi:hypothetical protein
LTIDINRLERNSREGGDDTGAFQSFFIDIYAYDCVEIEWMEVQAIPSEPS